MKAALAFLFSSLACCVFAQEPTVPADVPGQIAAVEILTTPIALTAAQPATVRTPLNAADIAPHFTRLRLSAGARLVLSDAAGRQVWSMDGPFDMTDVWLPQTPGQRVVISCTASTPAAQCEGTIDRLARGFTASSLRTANAPPLGLQQVCGTCGLKEARCFPPQWQARARAVARIYVNGTLPCTGFLIGSDGHLLTSRHCINSSDAARRAIFEFGAEEPQCQDDCGKILKARPATIIRGSELADDAPGLDVVLLKLPPAVAATYGFLRLRTGGPTLADDVVFIPQHPLGESKKISFDRVRSLDAGPCNTGGVRTITYDADTRRGSSGSPVLGRDELVIAVHTCGACPNHGIPSNAIAARLTLPPSALAGNE